MNKISQALIAFRNDGSIEDYVSEILFPVLDRLGIEIVAIVAPKNKEVSDTTVQAVINADKRINNNVLFCNWAVENAVFNQNKEGKSLFVSPDRSLKHMFFIDELVTSGFNICDAIRSRVTRMTPDFSLKEVFIVKDYIFDYETLDSEAKNKIHALESDVGYDARALQFDENLQRDLQGVKTTIVKKVEDLPFDYDNPPSGMLVIIDRYADPNYGKPGDLLRRSSTENFSNKGSILVNDVFLGKITDLQNIFFRYSKELIATRKDKLQDNLTKYLEDRFDPYYEHNLLLIPPKWGQI